MSCINRHNAGCREVEDYWYDASVSADWSDDTKYEMYKNYSLPHWHAANQYIFVLSYIPQEYSPPTYHVVKPIFSQNLNP
jgi:hypothetical protein